MTRHSIFLTECLLFCISGLLFAENIRGPVSGQLSLKGKQELHTQVEALTGIILDKPSPLIQGICISIPADEQMSLYRNSFALYLYRNLNENFDTKKESYQGSQALMRFIPFQDALNILIPLSRDHKMSPDRSSILLSDRDYSPDFPLVLTILPVSKGIPDSAYHHDILIRLTPVYFNKGELLLRLLDEEKRPIKENIYVSIDGKTVPWPHEEAYTLNSGPHHLAIRSKEGNEESLSFTLNPGETLLLDHVLRYQLPLLTVETIEGLGVFLDGKILQPDSLSEGLEIQPGSHSIRFQLGDFMMSRDFTAEMEQKISITMIPEIQLEYKRQP